MFNIGDTVKTLICEDEDIKRFPVGTIGEIVKSNICVPDCCCVMVGDKKWFYKKKN